MWQLHQRLQLWAKPYLKHWHEKPIVVLGIGELGSVFSRAFLENNHPVYPITRQSNIDELANAPSTQNLS